MSATAKALVGVGVLVALLGAAGLGAALWFQNKLHGNIESLGDPFVELGERPQKPSTEDELEIDDVNILVLGSDSRVSAGDPSQWESAAARTDAMMLVHLPADRENAVVMSIPRDSWVPIPGRGEAKINAAFAFGGPSLAIQTVEDLTGVYIDHFVVTDFDSFKAMTDALGGVDIRLAKDWNGLEAGVHSMDGELALAYSRERYALANGDFGRVQRQQNWMRAIMAKVNNNRSDVVAMTRFLDTVSQSVAADEGLTVDRMRELIFSADRLGSNDVVYLTAPHSGTGRSSDGQSIVVLDRSRFDPLMEAIAAGEAMDYIIENEDDLVVLGASVS